MIQTILVCSIMDVIDTKTGMYPKAEDEPASECIHIIPRASFHGFRLETTEHITGPLFKHIDKYCSEVGFGPPSLLSIGSA